MQNLTLNEVRSLRSIFNYFREVDEDASSSVICLAIIHALARNHMERSCMLRAIEDSASSKPASFLSIIDHGRTLFKSEVGENCEDELISQQYHLLRLVHNYHQKSRREGRYLLAQEFVEHGLRLRKDVEDRQIDLLRCKQNSDRHQLAMAHSRQETEFQQCE